MRFAVDSLFAILQSLVAWDVVFLHGLCVVSCFVCSSHRVKEARVDLPDGVSLSQWIQHRLTDKMCISKDTFLSRHLCRGFSLQYVTWNEQGTSLQDHVVCSSGGWRSPHTHTVHSSCGLARSRDIATVDQAMWCS